MFGFIHRAPHSSPRSSMLPVSGRCSDSSGPLAFGAWEQCRLRGPSRRAGIDAEWVLAWGPWQKHPGWGWGGAGWRLAPGSQAAPTHSKDRVPRRNRSGSVGARLSLDGACRRSCPCAQTFCHLWQWHQDRAQAPPRSHRKLASLQPKPQEEEQKEWL